MSGRHPHRRRAGGFTLIELMITLVIIGILAAIALPSYRDSIRKGRRTDARVTLNETAQTLERCRTQFGRYDDPACPVAASFASADGHYAITATVAAGDWGLEAEAQGDQLADTACATFTLDSLGVRTAIDADGAAASCW